MIILILAATEINRDVLALSQEWTNIAENPVSKEVKAFVDELQMNTNCCHSATKTFTRNPLTDEELIDPSTKEKGSASSDDAHLLKEGKHLITIFMSYSVPKSVWQGLWEEAEAMKQPIQFVLRGLPNNSFQELAKKTLEYGCPAMIDPPLFERYNITAVPAFLVKEQGVAAEHRSDKQDHNTVFYGNVSLSCVVEKQEKNTTEEATHKETPKRTLMEIQNQKETRS